MKHVEAIALIGAITCLVGCASAGPHLNHISEAVGPAPTARAGGVNESALQVYSARQKKPVIDINMAEFRMNNDYGRNDFLYEPAPTDFSIYTADGKLYQRVRNASRLDEETPALVHLPPGRYQVQAQARGVGLVTVPVVIEPGKRTVVNLQRNRRLIDNPADKSKFVWLAGARQVGWRAKGADALTRQ